MKSRYICMFACLWGLGFLFSCDGFLNENPKDKIPEEDAYKNLLDFYISVVIYSKSILYKIHVASKKQIRNKTVFFDNSVFFSFHLISFFALGNI